MRQFKHKKLGWLANKTPTCGYNIFNKEEELIDYIVPGLVEEGSDWEEIKEVDYVIRKRICKDATCGSYHRNPHEHYIACEHDPKCDIHTAFCPSTKLEFSIGTETNYGTIKSFFVKDGEMKVEINPNFMGGRLDIELSELRLVDKKEKSLSEKCADMTNEFLKKVHTSPFFDSKRTLYSAEWWLEGQNRKPKEQEKVYPKGVKSFKGKKTNHYFVPYIYQNISCDYNVWVKENLDNGHTIHSVKNDKGEGFTIGDEVKYMYTDVLYVWKIRMFVINKDNILVACGNDSQCEDVNDLSKYIRSSETKESKEEIISKFSQENASLKQEVQELSDKLRHFRFLIKHPQTIEGYSYYRDLYEESLRLIKKFPNLK